jgi:pentatricopeptide repeat protein
MRNLYRKVATLRDLLRSANRNLRSLGRQGGEKAFWERERKNESDMRDALALFRDILDSNGKLGDPLGPAMMARMAFTLCDRLGRHGMVEDSLRLLDHIEGVRPSLAPGSPEWHDVLTANGLAIMSLVLVRLLHIDIPASKAMLERLDALDSSDVVLRQKAGAGYYLAYGILTLEGDAEYVEALVRSFSPFRDRIRDNPVNRAAEVYFRGEDGGGGGGEPGPPTVRDFPLALGVDGQRLLMLNLPHDLPHVGKEENTAEVLASMDMMLMVYWGSSGDVGRSLRWFDEIDSWGRSGSILALQAQAATYMIHYIGESDPDAAVLFFRRIFGEKGGEPAGTGFPQEKSQAAVNLLGSMSKHKRTDELLRIFGLMYERPYFRRSPDISSRSIYLVVESLASQGRIEEALEVFRLISDFGLSMEAKMMHAKAAVALIYYSGLHGTEANAREVYDYVMAFPDQRDSWLLRSRTSAAMASVCELNGDIAGALEVFNAMPFRRGILDEDRDRAEAAHSVIRLLGRRKDGHGALEVFHSLGPWGSDYDEMDVQRAGALVNLVLILGKCGMVRKARDLYAAMPGWGASAEMDVMHAKAAVNLVAVLEEAGEARKAQAVYDTMGVWGGHPDLCCEKAKAAVTLIGLYGRLGDTKRAQAVFDGLPSGEISPAYQEIKEGCLLNLLTALAMARRWTEALKAATGPAAGLLSSSKREEFLRRLDVLMTKSESMGGRERRKVLSFLSERLRNH